MESNRNLDYQEDNGPEGRDNYGHRPANPYRTYSQPDTYNQGSPAGNGEAPGTGGNRPANPYTNPYSSPYQNPYGGYGATGAGQGQPQTYWPAPGANPYQATRPDEAFGQARPPQPAAGYYQNNQAAGPQRQQRVLLGVRTGGQPRWTYVILGIIVVVFMGQMATGGGFNGGIDQLLQQGALIKSQVQAGEWWRLITPIFLHFGVLHIAFNALALYALGVQLEQLFGSSRFLLIFFLTGIGGNVLPLLMENSTRPAITAGASGAIFGLLGALIAFFYRNRDRMGTWGRANLQSLLITAGLNLFITISIPGISIYGHLGGFLTGLFLGYFLAPTEVRRTIGAGAQEMAVRARDFFYEWWAVPALLAIEAVVLYVALQGGQPF